jgi:peroxiredoxin Q/BCP
MSTPPFVEFEIHTPVPKWTAESTQGSLSSDTLHGHAYILYFYPKDLTPGCTTQACDFRDHLDRLATLGYQVIGVSPDSLKRHETFQQKHQFSFTLIADEEHQLAYTFGVWREKKNYGRTYMGIVRSTFVVDAHGSFEEIQINVRAKGHVDRLLKCLQKTP